MARPRRRSVGSRRRRRAGAGGQRRGPALDLLAAGKTRTSAAEFFGADNARRLLEVLLAELGDRYDVVIVDAPALLQVTHAATLAGCADGVLVVVSHGGALADQEEIGRRLRLIGRAPFGYSTTIPRAGGSCAGARDKGRSCRSPPPMRRSPLPGAAERAGSVGRADREIVDVLVQPARTRPCSPTARVAGGASPTRWPGNAPPGADPARGSGSGSGSVTYSLDLTT